MQLVREIAKIPLPPSKSDLDLASGYTPIRTDLRGYGLPDALPCPPEATRQLAAVPTRLVRLDDRPVTRLMNWGHAACDAALRRYVDQALAVPASFIYPEFGV